MLKNRIISPVSQGLLPHSTSPVRELRAALGVGAIVDIAPHAPGSLNCRLSRCQGRAAVQAKRGEMSSQTALLSAARHPTCSAVSRASQRFPQNSFFRLLSLIFRLVRLFPFYRLKKETHRGRPCVTLWGHQDPNPSQSNSKTLLVLFLSRLGFNQVLVFFHLSKFLDPLLLFSALNLWKK